MKNGIVDAVTIKGNQVQIVFTMDKDELIKDAMPYDLQSNIREKIAPIIVEEILEKHKDMIIKQVLAQVNWPEIVRSKIAQRVIAEAGRSNW